MNGTEGVMRRWFTVAAVVAAGVPAANAGAATLPVTGTLDLGGTPPGTTTWEAKESGALAGASLAAVGDFDGDGRREIAVGEPRHATPERLRAGAVQLLPAALTATSAPLTITGAAEDLAGTEVEPAGDLNADGRTDLLIGAPGAGSTVVDGQRVPGPGAAYVVFGRAGGAPIDLATDPQVIRITGTEPGSRLGAAVSVIGDLNGDGVAELVVAAPSRMIEGRDRAGSTFVIHGRTTPGTISVDGLVERGEGWRIDGPVARDGAGALSGRAVGTIGDLNGDHRPELLITAPRAITSATAADGRAYVVFGRPDAAVTDLGALGEGGFAIGRTAAKREDGSDWLGESIAATGDVNGDGRPDLVVGAHLADAPDRPKAGVAYVLYGRPGTAPIDLDALAPKDGYRIEGVAARDMTGFAVAAAGDVNADGLPDVLVSAPFADPEARDGAGSAYVVFGRQDRLGTLDLAEFGDRALRISGAAAGDVTGFSVTGAGDLDGDKGADVLLSGTRIADDFLFSGRADKPGVIHLVRGATPAAPATAVGPAAITADPGYAESLKAGCRIATNVQALIEDNGYTDEAADPKRIRRDGLEAYVDDPRNADSILGVSGFPSVFEPTVLGGARSTRLVEQLRKEIDGEDDFPGYVTLVQSLGVQNPAAQARILLVDGYLFRDMADYDGLTDGNPPTYVIAVGRPPDRNAEDIRELRRLAVDTKGGLYRAENPREIERAFQRIESRLRCDVTTETDYDEIFPGEPEVLVEDEIDDDAETADVELTWRDPDEGFEIEEVDVIDDDGGIVRRIDQGDVLDAYGLSRTAARRASVSGARGQTYRELHVRNVRAGTRLRVKVRTQKGSRGGRVYGRITQSRMRR